eukprot:scaffold49593_cov43-Prasinocladus_malaysianus.AAC.1
MAPLETALRHIRRLRYLIPFYSFCQGSANDNLLHARLPLVGKMSTPPPAGAAAATDGPRDEAVSARKYVDPPKPRSDASQAVLWSAGYMRPFTPPVSGGRNVECCIPVVDEDGSVRPCGATLKHTLGMFGCMGTLYHKQPFIISRESFALYLSLLPAARFVPTAWARARPLNDNN